MSHKQWAERPLTGMTKRHAVQSIVDAMDPVTLWRWKQAIDKRIRRETDGSQLRLTHLDHDEDCLPIEKET